MEQTKLLIADNSDEFRQALAAALSSSYQIRTCSDGMEALQLLQDFQPDILVLELMLPQLDGLTLLQKANQSGYRPKTLVVSRYFSPYVTDALTRLQVDYCMSKPCSTQALVCRIADFAVEAAPTETDTVVPEDWVSAALLQLGIGAHLDGFTYLKLAIPLFHQDTSQGITKELYSAVAEACGKGSRQVERSIRSAIEGAWKRRNDRVWAAYFTPGPDGTVAKLSNGRFIAHMAQLLAQELAVSRSA